MGDSANGSRSARPVVAMVGAGQLARMTHQAAIALDVELRVLAAGPSDAAVRAGAAHLTGDPSRIQDLLRVASGADVVTFDHERIAPELLESLATNGARVAPSPAAKLLAQDKLVARRRLGELGFPVPPFSHLSTAEGFADFAERHGWPLVAKAPRGGYDGRGVFEVGDVHEATTALRRHRDGLLVEPLLRIDRELAVIVARSTTGESVSYPVVETVQQDAMCREITLPAAIEPALAEAATQLALAIAEQIDATGVIAVELFATAAGLLVNELALRPHNSGHGTIEGCATSQFEQHLRAVLGWPLGATTPVARACVTVNVVGGADGSDPAARLAQALAVPGAHVHLYGKRPAPRRKLGHVTACGASTEQARATARRAASLLEGEAA